jgi:hypothetical protein
MKLEKIKEAQSEAKRFLKRAEVYLKAEKEKVCEYNMIPKESGALRRSSLDLTRALADIRKV